MIVVDSSAVVAMMCGEPHAEELARRLTDAQAGSRLMSVANYVEAATVLAGRRRDPGQGVADLDAFLAGAGVTLAPVDEDQARIAIRARLRFGKGFGGAAKLNFGDCFAYALAKTRDAPLLFVGGDFFATDILAALA